MTQVCYFLSNTERWILANGKAAYPEVHWSIGVFSFFGFLKAEWLYFQLGNSSLIAVPFSIAPCQSSKHKHHGFKKCLQFREVPPVNPADISAQEPLSGVRLFLFLCSSSRLSPSQGRKKYSKLQFTHSLKSSCCNDVNINQRYSPAGRVRPPVLKAPQGSCALISPPPPNCFFFPLRLPRRLVLMCILRRPFPTGMLKLNGEIIFNQFSPVAWWP